MFVVLRLAWGPGRMRTTHAAPAQMIQAGLRCWCKRLRNLAHQPAARSQLRATAGRLRKPLLRFIGSSGIGAWLSRPPLAGAHVNAKEQQRGSSTAALAHAPGGGQAAAGLGPGAGLRSPFRAPVPGAAPSAEDLHPNSPPEPCFGGSARGIQGRVPAADSGAGSGAAVGGGAAASGGDQRQQLLGRLPAAGAAAAGRVRRQRPRQHGVEVDQPRRQAILFNCEHRTWIRRTHEDFDHSTSICPTDCRRGNRWLAQ